MSKYDYLYNISHFQFTSTLAMLPPTLSLWPLPSQHPLRHQGHGKSKSIRSHAIVSQGKNQNMNNVFLKSIVYTFLPLFYRVSLTDLSKQTEKIIFVSILTTFELSLGFLRYLGQIK